MILLALLSEKAKSYSYFTIPDWSTNVKNWFSSIRTPEMDNHSAYDLLLFLAINKNKSIFAKSLLSDYDKCKGMPNPKNQEEIVSTVNRYYKLYEKDDRWQNPYIDDEILQEIQEQYTVLSQQNEYLLNVLHVNNNYAANNEQYKPQQSNYVIPDATGNQLYNNNSTMVNQNDPYTASSTPVLSRPIETKPYRSMNESSVNKAEICPNCGVKIPQKSTFCYKCGYKIN